MSLPAGSILLPNAVHFKEFYGGYTGTCGETALTAALICAERIPDDHNAAVALMLAITSEMRQVGWASANGASTLWSLAREAASKRGAQIAVEWDYAEPFPHNWHQELLADAGHKPIVLQFANAQALPGDERGVHYHFIAVLGRCPAGYICMDGDNWQIEQNFVIYSATDLTNAVPCGLLTLEEKGLPVGLPSGWTDDGTALHNPKNAFVVTLGFRDYILSHPWSATDIPLCDAFGRTPVEYGNPGLGGGTLQYFRESGQLSYTQARGVFATWSGQEMEALLGRVAPPAPLDPAIKTALVSASQLLQPSASAFDEVSAALKKLG